MISFWRRYHYSVTPNELLNLPVQPNKVYALRRKERELEEFGRWWCEVVELGGCERGSDWSISFTPFSPDEVVISLCVRRYLYRSVRSHSVQWW